MWLTLLSKCRIGLLAEKCFISQKSHGSTVFGLLLMYLGRILTELSEDVFKQLVVRYKTGCYWASECFEVLNCFDLLWEVSGVFQEAFNTRISGIVISLGFLIPSDLLQLTASLTLALWQAGVCKSSVSALWLQRGAHKTPVVFCCCTMSRCVCWHAPLFIMQPLVTLSQINRIMN